MTNFNSNHQPALKVTAIFIIILAGISCSTSNNVRTGKKNVTEKYDSVLVDRDGNHHSVKLMPDNKLWMTDNLNLNIPGSYYYNDSAKNGERYGRLYTWEAAEEGCRALGAGWHLPTKDEWQQLERAYGGNTKDSIEIRKN